MVVRRVRLVRSAECPFHARGWSNSSLSVARLQRKSGRNPDLKSDALIDRNIVNRYRRKYVDELLRQERGELTDLDHQVAQSLASDALISEQTRLPK